MKRVAAVVSLVAVFFFGTQSGHAQNFYFNPQQTNQVESILQFFGSVAGGSIAHSGKVRGLGHIELDLHTVVIIVPDEFKDLPQFEGVDFVPIPMLQAAVGLPGDVEIFGRLFYWQLGDDPTKTTIPQYQKVIDSREGFALAGVGLKYGLLQMFGLPRIMLLGAYHVFLVPEQFDFGNISNVTGQIYVSYGVGFLTPYAAAGVNYSRFQTTFGDGETFTATLFTGTVGLEIRPLPLLHISADYNFSKFPNIGVSVGLSL
jgi:hypothetical protein